VSVWKNLCDPVTAKQKLLWPGDRIVTPVAALSIARMGVTPLDCIGGVHSHTHCINN